VISTFSGSLDQATSSSMERHFDRFLCLTQPARLSGLFQLVT
jgi:hypothetical protein